MNYEVVGAKQQTSLYFFAERLARLFQHHGIGGREIDQIVCVNNDGRNLGFPANFLEEFDFVVTEKLAFQPRGLREKIWTVWQFSSWETIRAS